MADARSLIGASKPEAAIYYALTKLGEPFQFQTPLMGGRMVKGGSVADFVLYQYNLIISVIGWYWHAENLGTKAKDMMQRVALESSGMRVIYIDEDDANRDATYYVQEAIRGVDHSRYRYLG